MYLLLVYLPFFAPAGNLVSPAQHTRPETGILRQDSVCAYHLRHFHSPRLGLLLKFQSWNDCKVGRAGRGLMADGRVLATVLTAMSVTIRSVVIVIGWLPFRRCVSLFSFRLSPVVAPRSGVCFESAQFFGNILIYIYICMVCRIIHFWGLRLSVRSTYRAT